MLKKQAEELGNGSVEDETNQHDDEEIEANEDENEDSISAHESALESRLEELYRLREEDDILRCQVEALKNEIMEMHATHEENMERRRRMQMELLTMKQTIDDSKKALLYWNQKCSKEKVEASSSKSPPLKRRKEDDDDLKKDRKDLCQSTAASTSSSTLSVEKEARFLGLISIFLHVLPFGANVDYICSYLNQVDSTIKAQDVENLLKKHPSMFKKNSVGSGDRLSENWKFVSFQKK